MSATINLTRFVTDTDALHGALQQAWPVSILAQGTDIDDYIFVYHVGKQDDPITGDRFECVASVNQLYELPKGQATALTNTDGIPYYRSNVLEYVARSAAEADRIWQTVQSEVSTLVRNWSASLRLKADVTVTIT